MTAAPGSGSPPATAADAPAPASASWGEARHARTGAMPCIWSMGHTA